MYHEHPQLSVNDVSEYYPPHECVLDELVHRLSSSGSWIQLRMILHRQMCLFIDVKQTIVIDSIPIVTIVAASRCIEVSLVTFYLSLLILLKACHP